MKQIILTLFLWTVFCLTGMAQAKATFDKKVHEFGVVLWKHPATATFTIKNDGNKPLVISNVTTSCGCTDAEWTKTPIAPGATGKITSTFDAKALGRFQKSIGVYCNASNRPIYLTLRGEVSADPKNYTLTHPVEIGAIRLNKDAIEFDDAHKGDKPTMELLVANTSNEVYTPVLMHLPPYLDAVAVPERKSSFCDAQRAKEILKEIEESDARLLVLLGDIPIKQFLKRVADIPYSSLQEYVDLYLGGNND